MLLGLADAPHTRQFGAVHALFGEHLVQQSDVSGVIFDQEKYFDGFRAHPLCLRCSNLISVSQKSSMLSTNDHRAAHRDPTSCTVGFVGCGGSPRTFLITASSLALSTGFCRKAFAPALSARSIFAPRSRAEITITGIKARLSFAFTRSMTLKPSPAGKPRSKIIKSGACFRASAILAIPSAAKIMS